ncbi:Cytosolic carboxypeptidase 1 [Physocladia obscura]|uniref:Cytosolic carboxypeptidase 1 n=1 Tax=Physocladia obscura TaxID=109957 RepID=A0AAD5T2A0_9FUNG|nr:Cytosolic carboxypeptidase 1 [Physocladia obscura]
MASKKVPSSLSSKNALSASALKKKGKDTSAPVNSSQLTVPKSKTKKVVPSNRSGSSTFASNATSNSINNFVSSSISKELDDAITGYTVNANPSKLGFSGMILPNMQYLYRLSKYRTFGSGSTDFIQHHFQHGNNISPPSSFLAAKAFDQLAALLAEPILLQPQQYQQQQQQPQNAHDLNTVHVNLSAKEICINNNINSPPFIALSRNCSDPVINVSTASVSPTLTSERDLRRRVVKTCLEIKRILDKESSNTSSAATAILIADSPLHKIFFSKYSSASGVSILLKCIKIVPDVDICIIVTNLILRIITSTSDITSSIAFLARKNASTAIITCLVGITSSTGYASGTSDKQQLWSINSKISTVNSRRKDDAVGSSSATTNGSGVKNSSSLPSGVPSFAARSDEAITNIFNIIMKLAKYDAKLSLIARLHGSIDIVVDIVKKWHDRKDTTSVFLGLQVLRVFAFKNGSLQNCDSARKSTLRLLKAVVETSLRKCIFELPFELMKFSAAGRKEFNLTDGLEILTSSLEELIQQTDISISFATNTTATIPSLLVAVLRAAVAEADLPFINQIQHRHFEIAVDSNENQPQSDALKSKSQLKKQNSGTVLFPQTTAATQEKLSDSTPIPTPTTPRRKKRTNTSKLFKQNSNTQLLNEISSSASSSSNIAISATFSPEEEVHLESLCPEMPWFCSDSDNKTEFQHENLPVLPTRILKSVFPTTFNISTAPFVLNRDPDDYRPSLKFHGAPTPLTIAVAATSINGTAAPSLQPQIKSPTPKEAEFQSKKSNNMLRRTIYEQTSRILKPGFFSDLIVYDAMNESVAADIAVKNPDELQFESRFESGNLQLAIKVQPTEYDLVLQCDIGSKPGRHNQWFYFSVKNMIPSVSYKFNIINMSKGNSQFGEGMQPVIYSKKEGVWRRGGENICFYKNHYRKPDLFAKSDETSTSAFSGNAENFQQHQNQYQEQQQFPQLSDNKFAISTPTYSTLTFHLKNQHQDDTLFIAYHYPYTVSDLTLYLDYQQQGGDSERNFEVIEGKTCSKFNNRCRRQALCSSVGGNTVELLTITAFDCASIADFPMNNRIYVHPGERVIQFLLSDDETANILRQKCVFKIVPMLNPDGVIAGNHRCGLAGTDLNRAWQNPSATKTPTIYWTKKLWNYLIECCGKRPLVSCDFHGHSKKKNIFIFGCENGPGLNDGIEKIFPSLLATLNPVFDPLNCKYTVEKSKESTARVVMWRELGVVGSYTLESSYCGADVGEKKGQQFQISDLEKVGVDFCCAVWASLGIFEGRVPVTIPKKDKEKSVAVQPAAIMAVATAKNSLGRFSLGLDGAGSDSSCDDDK